jgi:hypothetical protein
VPARPVGHPFERVRAHRAAVVHLGGRRGSVAAGEGSAVGGGGSGGGEGREGGEKVRGDDG